MPLCLAGLSLIILTVAIAPAADEPAVDMNVTRVALFSSGVGYFECDTRVTGDATAELAFRTDQINDILKSLVVQDFGGGTIGVVSYASRDPIEKSLRSFGVDITAKPTLGELLDQLRGEPVEVTGARSLKGTILRVEQHPILSPDGKTLQTIERLTLLTDAGLVQVPLAELQSIQLTNEKIDSELRKALATLATGHDADKKSVLIRFEGQGSRKVRAAYLLEAPIWKTSYRLVLTDDKKPFLQGWATVDNATEKDWTNVQLALVSGRPISFRMDLYTPIYVPRPVEQLELYASLRPPEYEAGFDAADKAERKSVMRSAGKARALAAPAPAAPMAGGGRAGAFAPSGAAQEPETTLEEGRQDLSLGGAGVASLATAQEAGELFSYNVQTPVSIPRQHSAMLPIVNQEVEGTKVSIYNPATHPKYPLNGLELVNATNLNLMQGPVTIFDADTYAGDAKLPDLKPGEKRLVAYALDLTTEVMVKQSPTPDELVSLRIAKGTLFHRHKYVDQREYVIKDKVDKPRTVVLEQAYSEPWKLVEPKEPYERTPNLLRFKMQVPAKETLSYKVQLERIADESLVLSSAGLDDIRIYLRAKSISPAVKQALDKVVALRTELDDARRQRESLEKQANSAVQEQARVRENLKTLQQNTDPYQRQLKKLDELETQIEDLRNQIDGQPLKHIDGLRQTEENKRKALEDYLLSLNIE